MSSEYGIRVTSIGPNRLAVLVRARSLLHRSPAEVKVAFDSGHAVELARVVSRRDLARLAAELRSIGAEFEIYVTTQCYSDCCFHEHGKAYFPPEAEKWYPKHLAAMNEPALYRQRTDTSLVQSRFLWLRTYHEPI